MKHLENIKKEQMYDAYDLIALMVDIDNVDLLRVEKEYSELSPSGRRRVIEIMEQLVIEQRNDYILKAGKFTKILDMFSHYEVTT